jgi:ferrous iron transport protein B
MRIALVGNPNVGKTTLFNALTGRHQRVGNWPGVTVAIHSGLLTANGQTHELIDLPGLYSLDTEASSHDEHIAADTLATMDIDCIINVVSARHLERHLYLTSQLVELGRPMVLAVTHMTPALDRKRLAQAIGCPVVPVDCLTELTDVAVTSKTIPLPWPNTIDPAARYTAVRGLLDAVQIKPEPEPERASWTDTLDRIVLQRFLAIPLFFGLMYVLFFVAMQGGGLLQQWFADAADFALVDYPRMGLQALHAPPWLIAWLANGIGRGLSTTLTFIPVMGCMFFCLSLLEASGYMARAAFIMDRVMRALGLPGKAFVPMIIGFGCNVPAVLATRILESKRERLLTIIMTPFMSCSARLAIYAVFVAAFFPTGGHNIVFSLYLMGIILGVLTGFMLKRTVLTGPLSPLILELPTYQWPAWRAILKDTWLRLREFIWRAGLLIVPVSALLGGLNALAFNGQVSVLAWIGQHIVWIFAPMGIAADNWPAAVGLMMGTLAKEVVVGTLGSLYAPGAMQQQFSGPIGAYAYLLFVLLYIPCVSTMAVIRQEANRHIMWFSIAWSTLLAYVTAVSFYQLATIAQHPQSSVAWILCCALLLYAFVRALTRRADLFASALQTTVGCQRRCTGCKVS